MWGSLRAILEEQYILARKLHITPLESNLMPDFERTVFVNMLMKEIAEEKKAMDGNK